MIITREHYRPLGKTGLSVPPIVFDASPLGDANRMIPDQTKLAIVGEWLKHVTPTVVVETAREHGAGRALEMLANAIRRYDLSPDDMIVSIQLGWRGTPPPASDPTFEPDPPLGVDHVSAQQFGYSEILARWEAGCRLLGRQHPPQLVSVHNPDDYLHAAPSAADRDRRFQDIRNAYRALGELKAAGHVRGIGVGAKDWRIVQEIEAAVSPDWVELAGSLTILRHPPELLAFVEKLHERQIAVIIASPFQSGFLVGGKLLDGRFVDPESDADRPLLAWRKSFVALCEAHGVRPAHACVQFGLSVPGVVAVTVNTSHVDRVAENLAFAVESVPAPFWESLKEEGLLASDYPYV